MGPAAAARTMNCPRAATFGSGHWSYQVSREMDGAPGVTALMARKAGADGSMGTLSAEVDGHPFEREVSTRFLLRLGWGRRTHGSQQSPPAQRDGQARSGRRAGNRSGPGRDGSPRWPGRAPPDGSRAVPPSPRESRATSSTGQPLWFMGWCPRALAPFAARPIRCVGIKAFGGAAEKSSSGPCGCVPVPVLQRLCRGPLERCGGS